MVLIQMTGLSGAGKTTIANKVKKKLIHKGFQAEVLDGDTFRKNIYKDLGFSKEDRFENIRRMGFVADLLVKKQIIVIIAAINPYEEIRKELFLMYNAKTIYINCDIGTLKQKDTKGLYKRAFLPENHPKKINNLTGVNDVYQIPQNADLVINTAQESVAQSVQKVINFILKTL